MSAVGYVSCVHERKLRVIHVTYRMSNSARLATLTCSNDPQIARVDIRAYLPRGYGDPVIQSIHSGGRGQIEVVVTHRHSRRISARRASKRCCSNGQRSEGACNSERAAEIGQF